MVLLWYEDCDLHSGRCVRAGRRPRPSFVDLAKGIVRHSRCRIRGKAPGRGCHRQAERSLRGTAGSSRPRPPAIAGAIGSGRVVVARREVWWAELAEPSGSEPAGCRRPILVAQADRFNRSRLPTVIGIALTSNTRYLDAPGNVLLPASRSGLPRDSVRKRDPTGDPGRGLSERTSRADSAKAHATRG